jgi:hypothetical protein
MASNDPYELGRVERARRGNEPPTSSLVEALGTEDYPADAIVLRGYLGRSDILQRAHDYLERAKNSAAAKKDKAAADERVAARGQSAATKEKDEAAAEERSIQGLIGDLDRLTPAAQPHVPWRIYLTPQLDAYLDFHLTDLIAYRREPRTERRDTCTVWLRAFTYEGKPTLYRVIQESRIGPSFAAYLGGDLVDDYLGPGWASSAWGDQSTVFAGKPGTGVRCGVFGGGRPGTGTRCAE